MMAKAVMKMVTELDSFGVCRRSRKEALLIIYNLEGLLNEYHPSLGQSPPQQPHQS